MASARIISLGDSLLDVALAINQGIVDILGPSGTQATLFYTGFKIDDEVDYAKKFDELILSLRKMFGVGSTIIEKKIAKSIFTQVHDKRAIRSFITEFGPLCDSLLLVAHETSQDQGHIA